MVARRRFTIQELALFFGVHRHTMAKELKARHVDLYDPVDVIRFIVGYAGQRYVEAVAGPVEVRQN